ncbi:uncharacterized protein LOC143181403 [Calliopsis andreniformis]|uniref:uncharacterized protein LOC143181403 n=1 Tax=Calliopsis andreniformis TaxID=337506 RepID=UPI003FCE3928
MALSVKQEGSKQVPWFSLTEWHQVYKQIYSNDTVEQTKAYEMLLAWKARMPKLPVGVHCTLSVLQVCLRDREWTPKINKGELPISYENDLCLMYSTTIMRFLNHISNIGHTKQTSLFQIAKQLNIPEWIVSLRHDTAHGHELPSIGVLRIAINLLLTWLHDEYWAAEAKKFENANVSAKETEESEEVQEFGDLVELWTAVSLYIHAGYSLVSNIPDPQLQETLQDLHSYALSEQDSEDMGSDVDNYVEITNNGIRKDKKYTLNTARVILLSEISRYLSKKSIPNKKDIVCDALFNSQAFLPSTDILSIFGEDDNIVHELKKDLLPLDMMEFWKDIIFLLYEKEMMEIMILELLRLVDNEEVNKHKRLLASLWISSISYSYVKLDAAHSISRTLEYELDVSQKRLPPKTFELKVKEETDIKYPRLKNVLWFNLSDTVLPCFTDINFVSRLILNANEFYIKFILPILELISPKIDEQSKQLLLNLVNIYAMGKIDDENSNEQQKTFTLKDIQKQYDDHMLNKDDQQSKSEDKVSRFLIDQNVRNPHWKLANANCNWAESPIGLLPWQIDSLETLNPLETLSQNYNVSALESEIVPGIIDSNDLRMQSQINWDTVLRKKKRLKRRHERRNADIIVNRALETAKKQK